MYFAEWLRQLTPPITFVTAERSTQTFQTYTEGRSGIVVTKELVSFAKRKWGVLQRTFCLSPQVKYMVKSFCHPADSSINIQINQSILKLRDVMVLLAEAGAKTICTQMTATMVPVLLFQNTD
jgi:hypothetical protein